MEESKEEKRDLRRMAKFYEREYQKMVRMAKREERLIRKGRITEWSTL